MTDTLMNDSPFLASLNDAQRQAVEAVDGAVLVIAGAGTGKTRVLTTRIAHIVLNKFAFPGEILAVTFTNKASREMSERIQSLLSTNSPPVFGGGQGGEDVRGGNIIPWMGTFHSICAKILRRHAELMGFSSSYTILNDDDQQRLIKTLLSEMNIDEKAMPAKLVHVVIQKWKDQGLNPEQVTNAADRAQLDGQGVRIYAKYQERLRQVNAMDFGDLLLHCLTMFTKHDQVLQQYARRFKYILVDEYQDTNVAQYLWLRLLALGHGNLCCVGDDDQSIYSWRGAEVGNILRFEKDYPGAKLIRLECNYRSTGHILAAAGALIANNKGRLGKELWTPGEQGEKLTIRPVWDDKEEAGVVGDWIEDMQRGKHSLNQMAILVRAGFQTRSFEERFLTLGLPYRVIGGLRFYERAEIRDAVAYLRVISSPDDDLAFERIVNVPKRGVGQATLQKIHSTAREMDGSLYTATQRMLASGELKGKIGAALGVLIRQFESWRQAARQLSLGELTERMLEESGYRPMWQQDKSPEAQGRLENLRELVRALGEFETLADFLEHVSLVTDRESSGNDEMVSLMTLHAAKGLEFDVVFLPGWEEGLFPHQRALDESGGKGLEEERRLAYVGITRARKRVMITHAANRRIYNQWQSSVPSRFLGELPQAHIEQMGGGARGHAGGWKDEVAAILGDRHAPSPLPSLSSPPIKGEGFTKNTRVFHQKFGYGKVLSSHGNHLEIAFEKAGTKKVLADFVEKA